MTLSPKVAGELLALLTAAGRAAEEASRFLGSACSTCGHPETSHDLDRKGRRTACSVTTGPTGDRCACRAHHPLTGTEVAP